MSQTWTTKEKIAPGIVVYKNVFKNDGVIQNRLEKVLSDINNGHKWAEALVGYGQSIPDYRDCVDFKFKKTDIQGDTPDDEELRNIWQNCYDAMLPAVQDYCAENNVMELRYWEAMNFIKYEKGKHFSEHHDHGYSYNCVVSLVAYLNDDYQGGELYFRTWGLNYKPEAGDVVLFPSNYMYPHQAKVVTEGTKYAIVTMLDYSAKYHSPEFYQETGN